MKRKISALMLVGVLTASLLAGCGKTDTKTGDKGNTDVSKDPVTLQVWESTLGPDEFVKQAGEAFNKKYPNITVEFVNVELGDSASRIALDGPAGVGPDLFAAPHDKLGELVAGGHVLPTKDEERIKGQVLGSTSTALTSDNKMYGYPISAETYALYYNKALIKDEEVPKTWEELVTFAEKFNAANKGKYGFMMDVGNGYYSIIFTTSKDNRLFGPSGTDTTATNINSAASAEGMKFFKDLRKILDVPAEDLPTAVTDAAFASGTVALYITGPWNIANFEDAGIEFGVAPLPSLPGNSEPVASFSGTRAMFVSAYTDNQAEAELFAEFLISEEMQKLRFNITGALPSIDIAIDSPYASGFLKQLDYAFPMPSIPQMSAFWDAMNSASANIWNGADIQQELDAANGAILGK